MKPKKNCELCKHRGFYPNGKARCEREQYVQPLLQREQEACEHFEALEEKEQS